MTERYPFETTAVDGMRVLGQAYAYVLHCGLPKALIDLVFLRASQINGCAFCIDMHTQDALRDGAPVEKLMLVCAWREGGAWFTQRERAALAWTESVTLVAQTGVPDADYDAAAAEFNARELTDLTIAIGLINLYNRNNVSFRRKPASLLRKAAP